MGRPQFCPTANSRTASQSLQRTRTNHPQCPVWSIPSARNRKRKPVAKRPIQPEKKQIHCVLLPADHLANIPTRKSHEVGTVPQPKNRQNLPPRWIPKNSPGATILRRSWNWIRSQRTANRNQLRSARMKDARSIKSKMQRPNLPSCCDQRMPAMGEVRPLKDYDVGFLRMLRNKGKF